MVASGGDVLRGGSCCRFAHFYGKPTRSCGRRRSPGACAFIVPDARNLNAYVPDQGFGRFIRLGALGGLTGRH